MKTFEIRIDSCLENIIFKKEDLNDINRIEIFVVNEILSLDLTFPTSCINIPIHIRSLDNKAIEIKHFKCSSSLSSLSITQDLELFCEIKNPEYLFLNLLPFRGIKLNKHEISLNFLKNYTFNYYYLEKDNFEIKLLEKENDFILEIKSEKNPLYFISHTNFIFLQNPLGNNYFSEVFEKNLFNFHFLNSNVNFINENHDSFKEIEFPFILFVDCVCVLNTSYNSSFSFIALHSSSVKLSNIESFNGCFLNEKGLNLSLFDNRNNDNLQIKHKLNLIHLPTNYLYERFNLLNKFLSYFFFFKLKLSQSFSYLIFIILIGSFIFSQKQMTPADPVSTQTFIQKTLSKNYPEYNIQSKEGWSYILGYQQYNSILYSLDLAIPFLDLGQTKSWIPLFDDKRFFVDFYYYFLKIVSKFLLLGSLLKLIKKFEQENI